MTIDGKKISGSAQYVRNGRLLHHGCILLDCDAGTLARALRPGTGKIASKSIKSRGIPAVFIGRNVRTSSV